MTAKGFRETETSGGFGWQKSHIRAIHGKCGGCGLHMGRAGVDIGR
jgi:hypothetical protein